MYEVEEIVGIVEEVDMFFVEIDKEVYVAVVVEAGGVNSLFLCCAFFFQLTGDILVSFKSIPEWAKIPCVGEPLWDHFVSFVSGP